MYPYEHIEFIPYPLLAGLALLGILLVLLQRDGHRLAYLFCFSVFWLYLLLVVCLTIFPISLPLGQGERQSIGHILSRVNLIPFSLGGLFMLSPRVIFDNLAGNVLLTLPFGFGINFIARPQAKHIPWMAVGVGLAIETTQLTVSLLIGGAYRGVDVNDLLLNALGVLVGYGLFRGFVWLYRTVARRIGIGRWGLFAYILEVAQRV
jgi:glycopeptide antibiotics resistance protein